MLAFIYRGCRTSFETAAEPCAASGRRQPCQLGSYERSSASLTGPARLWKQQSNFADETWCAPIETYLTPELASNYVLYDAGAAPALRGGAMVGPPDSIQRKLRCPSAVRDHAISMSASAADSEPYFAALVASSCNEIAIA